jgi:hypothetical protein
MTAPAAVPKTEWHIEGENIGSCTCDWGCPCQFNAFTTHGSCEALVVLDIQRGHDGDTPSHLRIPGLAESQIEPIRNPVTGEEHRVRIDLPHGFEYLVAEMRDSVHCWTKAGEHIAMEHEQSYAQMAHINWSSDGTVR